jgi:DMSO/TMAO reductase YedYZ molybdopterin-dependent catalytic subunit
MVVSAVVVLALIAGAAWAAGRPQESAEKTAASASASPAGALPATLAALDETPAPGTPASPAATLASEPTSEAPAVAGEPAPEPASTPAPRATPTPTRKAAASTPTPTPTPGPTKTRKPASTPKPTPKPTRTASAVPAAAHLVVKGKVARTTYFTLKQLRKLRAFSGDYFSRGKEPEPTTTNAFTGVRLTDILKAAGVKKTASRVTILAADDYSASFSMRQVSAAYLDETRPGVTLPMIVAWSEDGVAYTGDHPFRLVMGQAVEGDYNRQYWVRLVVTITVD